LNDPFVVRCFRWLGRGLTLNWGETNIDSGSWGGRRQPIRAVIRTNLPRTLLIFGTANLALFLTTVLLALPLSRKHGNWVDRLVIGLSPLSSAPAWVYGIILNLAFLRIFGGVFSGGTFDAWPDEFRFGYIPMLLKHMALPFLAIFLSGLFQGIYAWRMFFLVYASEDYVEMARAKGLPPRMLERRYIIRPILPTLLTSFALLFTSLWQEVIILEHFFNVAGIGRLFVRALARYSTPVIVALVVTFAYLLAITVFLLDIAYALVDPRVSVEGRRRAATVPAKKRKAERRFWPPWALLRRPEASHPLVKPAAGRVRAQPLGRRGSPILTGAGALEEILGGFPVAENVQADWVTGSGGEREAAVDRLYPELGIAVQFTQPEERKHDSHAGASRQAGVTLLGMDPDRPVSADALREIRSALSAAARRVAQRPGAYQVKLTLMPRIAAAESACQRVLDGLEGARHTAASRKRSRWQLWRGCLSRWGGSLEAALRQLSRYPSAAVGLSIIAALIGVSICTVIVLPYDEMIAMWRAGDDMWDRNPKAAVPAWVNLFRREDLPPSIVMGSQAETSSARGRSTEAGSVSKRATVVSEGMTEIEILFPFDFSYGAFPQDVTVYVEAQYDEKRPLLTLSWLTPDGREIDVASSQIEESYTYHLSQDDKLRRRLDGQNPVHALFGDPAADSDVTLQGAYALGVTTFVFEEGADADAEFVLRGQVHGLAGTDSRRRDLLIPLLWGMPVALAFGILAAVGTSVSSMVIAAVGTWFGGWVDALVQRITEVNMILPFLPVSIMVYTLYSKNFWVILGVTVLLSIFGSAIKNYRAIFLQVKELPYVEAAQAYGASEWRIVLRYLIPRIVPVLVPQLVILVPGYVFLEATLAFLGVSDPVLPTWGKLIVEGLSQGIHAGHYHLFLEPLGLLLLVGFAFVLLGVALERIFQPRLRER
jgi:peptide/nickel transport system permease protein